MPSKQTKKRFRDLKDKIKINKKIVIIAIVSVATIGAIFLVFAKAAPNNCQQENNVSICDVDMVSGGDDTVLSTNAEAMSLGQQGWPLYMGAVFRAPTAPYQGAVPVHRVLNTQYSWHDWVTDAQKRDKEAKYGANNYEGVSFYAWDKPGTPNTVPVYRITRGGAASQSWFSTDKGTIDRLVAEGANDPNGWKLGTVLPAIAFYAYPPNYKVADQPNPYDCSIQVNFVSERCAGARAALTKAAAAGNIPASNECPKTLEVYLKAPFASQFTTDCQKFWNTYMQDCSIQVNFLSDRCKTQRDALVRAAEEQAAQRAAAQAAAKKSAALAKKSGSSSSSTNTTSTTGGSTSTTARNCSSSNPTQAEKYICTTLFLNAAKASQKPSRANLDAFGPGYFGAISPTSNTKKIVKGDCRLVYYPVETSGSIFTPLTKFADWVTGTEENTSKFEKVTKNVTGEQCVALQKTAKTKPLIRDVKAYLVNQRYEYVKK